MEHEEPDVDLEDELEVCPACNGKEPRYCGLCCGGGLVERGSVEPCPLCVYQMERGSRPYQYCGTCVGRGYIFTRKDAQPRVGIDCIWCGGSGVVGWSDAYGCPICVATGTMDPEWLATRDGENFMDAEGFGLYPPIVDLAGIDVSGTNFGNSAFNPGAKFRRSNFADCDFSEASVPEATFEECSFRGAKFDGAKLAGSRFVRCDFSGSTIALAADIADVEFEESLGIDAVEGAG